MRAVVVAVAKRVASIFRSRMALQIVPTTCTPPCRGTTGKRLLVVTTARTSPTTSTTRKLDAEFSRLSAGGVPDLRVRTAQMLLTYRGFDPGPIDGAMGNRTCNALRQFQKRYDRKLWIVEPVMPPAYPRA